MPNPHTADAPTLLWFRQDLRLTDNPALAAAVKAGPVIPVFILDDETPGQWKAGGATRWWLHHSLEALATDLRKLGSDLVLRHGPADKVIPALVKQTGATAIFWNRQYEPWAIARDTRIKDSLKANGIKAESFNASLLREPWEMKTGSGGPYRVFTPFWRAARQQLGTVETLARPKAIAAPAAWPATDKLAAWKLLPVKPNWATGFTPLWTPGEQGARKRLDGFLAGTIGGYAANRDRPDIEATSRLSPHLHFGEISPRQLWKAATAAAQSKGQETNADKFLAEVGWREFSYHLLYHFPHLPERNYKESFDAFPWADSDTNFRKWCRGQTGYPIVDAGMRELWTTGFMHNRVRMVAASFLIKHLLIPWQRGEAWFWDTLVDADLASNSASWQWVAGSGADAAPYFRIFNPVMQGEKFDPAGAYVRKWVPELATCSPKFIHRPWDAPDFARLRYPAPMVDHATARDRALKAFKTLPKAE
jgi:deoxyribodipyrimidine photo-lyase